MCAEIHFSASFLVSTHCKMKTFKHKVAAITGAGSGIGRALTLELAKAGASLAISDIDAARVEETAELAHALGADVMSSTLDVSDKDAFFAWADEVAARFGKVNLIFNNAGVALSATVDEISYDDFNWVFDINFWGVFHGTKAFLPHLEAAGEGHIINISSVFGLIAVPGLSAYNTSKFAVRGFTETLRQELDIANSGVSCSCVHPGGIQTNIARDAQMRDSMKKIVGDDLEASTRNFEKLFSTTPEDAAKTILRGVQRNKRRILIGKDAVAIDSSQRLLPSIYQYVVGKVSGRAMSR